MYDSPEVKDAVRREALAFFTQRTGAFHGFADLPAVERATISEALEGLNARRRANMLEQFIEAVMTWFRPLMEEALEVMRSFFFQIGEVMDAARRAMAELAEAIELLEKPKPSPFAWQRRPRAPQVQPARPVDAVAAGRSPAMIMRTRIRGGRR